MSRCTFSGEALCPSLPFSLDLHKLRPEDAEAVEAAMAVTEHTAVPDSFLPPLPPSSVAPHVGPEALSSPNPPANQQLLCENPAVGQDRPQAESLPLQSSFSVAALLAPGPGDPPIAQSVPDSVCDPGTSTQERIGPSKRRRVRSARKYKPLRIEPVIRPNELGSEPTVASSVLYDTDRATSYVASQQDPISMVLGAPEQDLPTLGVEEIEAAIGGDILFNPEQSPLKKEPMGGSLEDFVLADPHYQELQEFQEKLSSTGHFPEGIVQQYFVPGETLSNPPVAPTDEGNEGGTVGLVDLARTVGVEVAQANYVLLKDMFDRQGWFSFHIYTVFNF